MKKFLSLALISAMVLSLSACGASQTPSTGSGALSSPQSENTSASGENLLLEGEISGQLNISCYETSLYEALLTEAAEKFQNKYPKTTINVETFSKPPEVKTMENPDGTVMMVSVMESDPQAESDYIFKTGNAIMSGQGADIYAMDVLPFYKYAQGGYLEDLSKYMEADKSFNISDYAANVLNAAKYNAKQYIIPLCYSYEVLTYSEDILGDNSSAVTGQPVSLNRVLDIGAKALDNYNSSSETPASIIGFDRMALLMRLFSDNYSSFVNHESSTANFDSQEFIDILEKVEDYAKKDYLQSNMFTAMSKGEGVPSISFEDMQSRTSQEFAFGTESHYGLLNKLNDDPAALKMMRMTAGSASAENNELGAMLANGQGNVEAGFLQTLAVNANSQNKALAWEFIKFLLSEEMQGSLSLMSLPVNNNALAEKSKLEISAELYMPAEERLNLELTESQTALYEKYMEALENYSLQVNDYTPIDNSIKAIVNETVNLFFNGEQTAQETAKAIQSKVTLYLNE